MTERAYVFGRNESLVGVVSEPENKLKNPEIPAVLLLNANVVHRVGPYRLYVNMARKLNMLGFSVFRFDLSGVGDSPAKRSDLPYEERSVSEVKEAMDFMSHEKGVKKFILFGLCAGADSSYRTAVADKRVAGIVLLDGYGYRTLGYYVRYYLPRLVSAAVWLRLLKRSFQRAIKKLNKTHEEHDMSEFYEGVRNFPPKKQMESELKELIKRNVNILCVFTGGLKDDYYNYKNQFRDMFSSINFNDKLQVEYYREAAHTFTNIKDRELLVNTISAWFSAHYSSADIDLATVYKPSSIAS